MSYEPSHATEHMSPPPAQAEEGINFVSVISVGVAAVVVFTVAVLIVFKLLHARREAINPEGPAPTPIQIGRGEIGIVDQAPFDVSRAVQNYRKDRLDRLEHWGWVDRKAGIVHMPIGEAMNLVVKEHEAKEHLK